MSGLKLAGQPIFNQIVDLIYALNTEGLLRINASADHHKAINGRTKVYI